MPQLRKRPFAAAATCAAAGVLVAAGALTAGAMDLGLKPGLWEVRVTKQITDGHDMSAQIAAAMSQAQQALASLPPDQRARLEAMMSKAGVSQGQNGGFRICVSPEMAKRSEPVLDKDGHCRPVILSRHGNQVAFQFSCTTNGATMQGHGEATVASDSVNTHTEMTTTSGNGTHQMQNDTVMSYLGTDCGNIKPPSIPPSGG